MNIIEATALIRTSLIEWSQPQYWCDLGCGSGTFTMALAHVLSPGSTIHAVDWDQRALENLPNHYDGVPATQLDAGPGAFVAVLRSATKSRPMTHAAPLHCPFCLTSG
jgi:trans-aconitate methyltransferase